MPLHLLKLLPCLSTACKRKTKESPQPGLWFPCTVLACFRIKHCCQHLAAPIPGNGPTRRNRPPKLCGPGSQLQLVTRAGRISSSQGTCEGLQRRQWNQPSPGATAPQVSFSFFASLSFKNLLCKSSVGRSVTPSYISAQSHFFRTCHVSYVSTLFKLRRSCGFFIPCGHAPFYISPCALHRVCCTQFLNKNLGIR